jgi:hypothetical protein
MWTWFSCYLSGRHDYGMWCEPGTIFLRCVHCGRRSSGWVVDPRGAQAPVQRATRPVLMEPAAVAAVRAPRVLPFNRASAS